MRSISLLMALLTVGAHAFAVPRTPHYCRSATVSIRVRPRLSEDQNPSQAIGIVSQLKSNAALFAAFAFGSLNLPSTLTVSESRVIGVGSSMAVAKPAYSVPLLKSYIVLNTVTLCCFVACVAISQLLIYRLADGSYGSSQSSDSALATLVQQYGLEFGVARGTFAFGLTGLLAGSAVRLMAIFNASIAVPATVVIAAAAVTIFAFYLKSQREIFAPLQENKSFGDTLVALIGVIASSRHGTRAPARS